jgi:hypothetical protein
MEFKVRNILGKYILMCGLFLTLSAPYKGFVVIVVIVEMLELYGEKVISLLCSLRSSKINKFQISLSYIE